MSINMLSNMFCNKLFIKLFFCLSVFFLVNLFNQPQILAKEAKRPTKITTQKALPAFPVNKERAIELSLKNNLDKDLISPLAIPVGTPLSNVSFFGLDTSSSVIVAADTNGDRVPDISDTFIASDDPANETTSAMTISKKSGKIYLGIVAADGVNKQNGQIIITDNAKQDFKATKQNSFSTGKGTPIGLTIVNSPKGDILIVASLFFSEDLFDITPEDSYTITAYLPNETGVPDGKNKVTILAANSTLNNQTINFGFGALAIDNNGNLYANLASKFKFAGVTQLMGAIMVFTDTNNDSVPDKPSIFVLPTANDFNPTTASSIIPVTNSMGDTQFFVYGINDVFLKLSQIVIYSDKDKDLKADSLPTVFYESSPQFQGVIGSFGKGSSALTISRLDFSEGQALFAFNSFDSSGNKVIDSGVALLKDNGTGLPSQVKKVFSPPKTDQTISNISFVVGVPGNNDKVVPTVKINNLSPGQKLNSNSPFILSFNATDDVGIVSINILLAINGETFNPLVLGLQGTATSFQFTIPNIATTTAVIRIQALDAGGNIGVATSSPFTIETDNINPTVIVISPKNKDKLKGNTMLTITFTSTDNRGVFSHEFQFSPDNGNNFVTFAQNVPGNIQSLTIPVPNMKINQALIKIIARDAAGNAGEGLSGVFKIKPSK
ncbi:MAG: hypothetical protein HY819_00905 [Acidobacteria bacterium]|nr:hypothetical protein [Acidobacteriota bacterium]